MWIIHRIVLKMDCSGLETYQIISILPHLQTHIQMNLSFPSTPFYCLTYCHEETQYCIASVKFRKHEIEIKVSHA